MQLFCFEKVDKICPGWAIQTASIIANVMHVVNP